MPINSREMGTTIVTRDPGWGHVRNLRVPMVECQLCHHDVICHFAVFEKNQRFWLDLDQDALLSSGLCESLRGITERWVEFIGGYGRPSSVHEAVNKVEATARK